MRSLFLAVVATLATTVFAASIPGLPACAANCVTSFGSCSSLDVKCICSDSSLLSTLACCVSTSCNAADQNTTIQFADSLCAGQGVTDLPTAATCSATSSGTATSTVASSNATAIAGATTTPASLSSALASASAAASSVSGSNQSVLSSVSASASSVASKSTAAAASAAATGTASGADKNGLDGVGLGLLIAGMVAAL